MERIHNITVAEWGKRCPIRKKTFKFVLLDNGQICGARLYKGNDATKARGVWPFKGDDWMFADTKKDAEKAAEKLQIYLDTRESAKAKKKTKTDHFD